MAEAYIKTIQSEFRRTAEARYIHRLHGVLLVLGGMSTIQAGRLLHEPQRTVAHWVTRYKQYGLSALQEAKKSGRPGIINARQKDALKEVVKKSPRKRGLDSDTWTGELFSKYLRTRYGIKLTMRHCRRLLKGLQEGGLHGSNDIQP